MVNDMQRKKTPAALSPRQERPRIYSSDLRILDKNSRIRRFKRNAAQKHLLAHLTGRDLVLKARQLGISTAIQAKLFLEAVNGTARIMTLAHDKDTTEKLRDMVQLFYDELPEDKRPQRKFDSSTRTSYPETKSMVYLATAGNPRAGRGGTYSHVHGSEVAFWKDGRRVMAGLLQGVPRDGKIVLESTPNGASGWFYEQCMAALAGDSPWTLHFYPWWWDKDYRLTIREPLHLTDEEARLAAAHDLTHEQMAWRRAKQLELGEFFAQEYPEDVHAAFLKGGDRYFGQIRSDTFSAPPAPEPQPGHRYVAGLDFGQVRDYTVCTVIDADAKAQVDILRVRRRSWADIRQMIVQQCMRWEVVLLVAESNSMGSTNIEALRMELDQTPLRTALNAFQTTHSEKNRVLSQLRRTLEDGGLALLNDPAQRHELEVFASRQLASGLWQHAAPSGEHDDTVMALALALEAMTGSPMVLFGR